MNGKNQPTYSLHRLNEYFVPTISTMVVPIFTAPCNNLTYGWKICWDWKKITFELTIWVTNQCREEYLAVFLRRLQSLQYSTSAWIRPLHVASFKFKYLLRTFEMFRLYKNPLNRCFGILSEIYAWCDLLQVYWLFFKNYFIIKKGVL